MRKVKRKLDKIDIICLELNEYNKKYGTNYTYGQYTTLVRLGKIKPNKEENKYGK